MTYQTNADPAENAPDTSNWKQIVARYQQPSVGRSVWQIANSVLPYLAFGI